jgi:hypothetical protein
MTVNLGKFTTMHNIVLHDFSANISIKMEKSNFLTYIVINT